MVISSWIRNLCLRLASRPIRQTPRRRNGRQVPIEALERRVMLSSFPLQVTTTADTPANDPNIFGATVSLREAINFADNNPGVYFAVSFAPSLISSGPARIKLTQGELLISSSMTITGLGAGQLTIDGNNASRIFDLNGQANNAVTITGLTLTGGAVTGNYGGAIFNNETLILSNDTIDNNKATGVLGGYGYGGGIYNTGTLTSTNDTIDNNSAVAGNYGYFSYGGGIYNAGKLTSTNDTIDNNSAFLGGGIDNYTSSALTSTNDTLYQNSASYGGGVWNDATTWNSLNTIVAGSTTGGDVYTSKPTINSRATLIGDSSLTGMAGIINATGGAATIFGTNTLSNIGGSTQTVALASPTLTNPAIGAAQSLANVTADNAGTSLTVDNATFIAAGDYLQIGPEIVLVQKVTAGVLTVARAQYGTTQTSLVGNPVYLATDATGAVRNSQDLGARASQHLLTVNTNADPGSTASIPPQGTMTLRNAITTANADVFPAGAMTGDTINFDAGLAGNAITLNGSELLISNSMTISGIGAAQLTIDGNNVSRIFDLNNGLAGTTVTITGLTLQHGNGNGNSQSGSGGAIFNNETLILSNDIIDNNNSTFQSGLGVFGYGGGIFNAGTLTSTNDSIDNNNSAVYGGGVLNTGTLSSTNDTIDNNTSTNYGGGIYNNSRLTTTNDLIVNNTAMSGGGVYNVNSYTSNFDTVDYNSASGNGGAIGNGGTLTITGSTVDYNTATQSGGGLYSSGTVASTGNTIANNSTASSGGGVFVSGIMTCTNDTIAKNTAAKYGGGIDNAGTLTTDNVTIYGNSAAGGGGVYNYGGTNVAVWNSLNTIVADSLSGNDVFQFGTIHATAMLIDDSLLRAPGITNVSGGPTSIFGSNTLADNGGPTQTVKLAVGSPAIGAAKALGNVIANGDLGTTLKVDTTTFLAPGDELKIGTEIVLVQKVSSGVLTVVRDQAGTTQTSLNGQPIILAYDQRGIARSVNDIGAVEMVTPTITITQNYVYTGTPILAVATVTANGVPVSDITPTITYYMPGLSVPLSSAPTRAGTYTVVATFAGNDVYTSQSTSTTIIIGKATPVVSVTDPGGTYNGSPFPATALVQGVLGSSNASLENVTPTLAYYVGATAIGTPSATAPTSAGTYTVVATFAGSWDYITAQSTPATFTINKATPVVSVTDAGGTFNGLPFPATALVQGVAGSPNTSLENVTPTLVYYVGNTATGTSSTSAPIAAGTYTVVATFAGSTDYTVQSAWATFTIGTATPAVSVTDAGGTYNGLPFSATGSVTGVANTVLGTPSFKYYLSTDLYFSSPLSGAPTNVGSYVVVASFAASGNYSGASQTAGFSITAAPVTLQIGNVTEIAGTAENLATDLGTTVSTGVNNEKFNIQYSSTGDVTTALIGTYPITGQLSDGTAKQSNYTVTLLPGTLTVIRKTITVNSTSDAAVAGKVTLRQAIVQANGDLNADQIVFDPSLSGSIVLTQGELAITHSMLIVGPGANKLTISGNKVSRIFDINGPSMTANSLLCVTVSGLTLTGGNGAASTNNGNGGAIYNHGQLTLTSDTITANTSSGYGGGLYNVGAVNSSGNTFSSNISSFGGGLDNDAGGVVRSTNDTFWGNTAYYGGAIKNVGLITTTDDTIAANNALNYGGGLFVDGTWSSMNSIVAGNSVSSRSPSEIYVDSSTVSNKGQVIACDTLIGDASSSGGIKNGVNGNIVGKTTKSIFVTDATGKPLLANNGGSTLTVALAANSPAIGTSAALTTVVTVPATPNGTSFTVSNPTYLAVGDLLKVGTEIVKVTSISGYTITVLRNQGGTANTIASTTPITLATNQLGQTRLTNNLGAL